MSSEDTKEGSFTWFQLQEYSLIIQKTHTHTPQYPAPKGITYSVLHVLKEKSLVFLPFKYFARSLNSWKAYLSIHSFTHFVKFESQNKACTFNTCIHINEYSTFVLTISPDLETSLEFFFFLTRGKIWEILFGFWLLFITDVIMITTYNKMGLIWLLGKGCGEEAGMGAEGGSGVEGMRCCELITQHGNSRPHRPTAGVNI